MTGPFSHEVHSDAVLPQIFCAPPSFVVPRKICFKQISKTKKIDPLNLAMDMPDDKHRQDMEMLKTETTHNP